GGSPRRPCRGQRQPRQSLRRESRDQEGDAGPLSGLSPPLQAPLPVSQLVIRSPAPVVPALAATAGEVGFAPENQVCTGLPAGGRWIRTIGPPPEIVVDPSGSRTDHRAKYGCFSARPRVRYLCPPGKNQHLLPKSVFDRPGSDRWNLASTTFPDDGGRDAHYWAPPAQNRTCSFPAYGSHLGCLTAGLGLPYALRRR